MKRVVRIETSDGALHKYPRDAQRHAEKRYGDLLLSHGRNLANQGYVYVTEYINDNLDSFVALAELKADRILERDDDEDED